MANGTVPLKAGDVLPTGIVYTGPPSTIDVAEYAGTSYSPPAEEPAKPPIVSRLTALGISIPAFMLPAFAAHPVLAGALLAIAAGAAISQIPEVKSFFVDLRDHFTRTGDQEGLAATDAATAAVTAAEQARLAGLTDEAARAVAAAAAAEQARLTEMATSLRQEQAAVTQMQQFMSEQAAEAARKADEIIATAQTRAELTYRLSTMLHQHFITAEVMKQITDVSTATWDISHYASQAEAEAAAAGTLEGLRAIDPEAADDMGKMGLKNLAMPLTVAGMMAAQMVMSRTLSRQQHQQGLGCMATTGGMLASNVLGAALPLGLAAGVMFNPQLQGYAKVFANNALNLLYRPMEDMAPITPDKAPGVGVNLLLQAVAMGAAAHLVSVSAEAVAPLKHMGLGYLSAFLADMAGFSRIAGAFQGSMIQWGLAQPMRYWALSKFRPMILEPRDFSQLMSRRAFTEPETLRVEGLAEAVAGLPGGGGEATEHAMIGYMGYPDNYYALFQELANTPLRYFPLAGIARSGFFDKAWFEEALARSGYSKPAKEQLLKMYEWQVLEATQGTMSGAVTTPYRYGYINDDELKEHLANLGYHAKQIEPILYAVKLDRSREQAKDLESLYIDQFKKGLIDEGDLKVALATIIVDPSTLQITLQRAVTAVTPKVAKEKPPETKAITRELQTKYVQLYRELYRKYEIGDTEFLYNLLAIELDPDLARVTVALEAAKKLPKPEVVSP